MPLPYILLVNLRIRYRHYKMIACRRKLIYQFWILHFDTYYPGFGVVFISLVEIEWKTWPGGKSEPSHQKRRIGARKGGELGAFQQPSFWVGY